MKKSRNTKQKELIQKEIDKLTDFFTAESLLEKVKKKDSSIGIATIYRYLNHLKKQSSIHSYLCDRRTIYSNNKKSHCHYICEKTGQVIHFDVDSIDFLKSKIPGTISSFQIEVRGTCQECKD